MEQPARLIWSLAGSGLGTTIAASGNSGAYQAAGPPPWTPNNLTPVDLRFVDDIWLTVSASGAGGTSPTLGVTLGGFDDLGNLFLALVTVPNLTGAGKQQISAGRHGSSGNYNVFPAWGQVAWVLGGSAGPNFTGVEISVWGRG